MTRPADSALLSDVVRRLFPRPLRNALRSPMRTARWLLDDARHRLGFDEAVRLRADFSFRSHPAAYRLAYFAQEHDPEQVLEFDRFVASCGPGMLLFDLGAHFGLFSLAAAHYGGAAARAVAVDASPTAIDMTRRQAAMNGMAGRVTTLCSAVGATSGSLPMLATGPRGAGYFVASDGRHPASDLTATPLTTIDALALRHGPPTHVKIDVEGFEADVLRGGRATLTGARPPLLFLELHHAMLRERACDPREALALLEEYGFDVQELDGAPADAAALLARPLARVVALPRVPAPSSGTTGRLAPASR